MKHKHADLIHAWADGAKIQVRVKDGVWLSTDSPAWNEAGDVEYRIKPEEKKPVVRWLWAYPASDGMGITSRMHSETEIGIISNDWVKLEWSRQEFPE